MCSFERHRRRLVGKLARFGEDVDGNSFDGLLVVLAGDELKHGVDDWVGVSTGSIWLQIGLRDQPSAAELVNDGLDIVDMFAIEHVERPGHAMPGPLRGKHRRNRRPGAAALDGTGLAVALRQVLRCLGRGDGHCVGDPVRGQPPKPADGRRYAETCPLTAGKTHRIGEAPCRSDPQRNVIANSDRSQGIASTATKPARFGECRRHDGRPGMAGSATMAVVDVE